jgi:hypothetical protein
VHAAPGVLNYISDHPEQRHLLGVPTVHQNHPGEFVATCPFLILMYAIFEAWQQFQLH